MTDRPDLTALLAVLERAAREVPVAEVPALLGELERLRGGLWVRISAPRPAERNGGGPERLLTPREVSARASLSVAWLYRHADALPFTRRIGRKVLFSESGLSKWLAQRAP